MRREQPRKRNTKHAGHHHRRFGPDRPRDHEPPRRPRGTRSCCSAAGRSASPTCRTARRGEGWDAQSGEGWAELVNPNTVIVNLAGESLAHWRWTKRTRRTCWRAGSRRRGRWWTRSGRPRRTPRLVIQASAVGYYGDRGDEELTELSAPGEGFLAETVQAVGEGHPRRGPRAAPVRPLRRRPQPRRSAFPSC